MIGIRGTVVGILVGLALSVASFAPVVSSAAASAAECPSEGARTGYSAQLPDCRAYELVSPAEKHGALIEGIGQEGVIQAATDGEALTYFANAPIDTEPAGYANEQQLLSTRGPAGWSTQDIAIPHKSETGKSEGVGEDYRGFSENLSRAAVQPTGAFTPLSPEASEQTAYLRSDFPENTTSEHCPTPAQLAAGFTCYQPLVTGQPGYANVPPGTKFGETGNTGGAAGPCPVIAAHCGPEYVGATPDLTHIIIHSAQGNPTPLTEIPTPHGGLYEWAAGKLTLISVLPKTEPAAPEEAAASPSLGERRGFAARNATSTNGNRVFWTAENEATNEAHLYLRDIATRETIQLDTGLTGEPRFQIASTTGNIAYFTEYHEEHSTLYECLIPETTPLSCSPTPVATNLQGDVIGASNDGTTVYYVADPGTATNPAQEECNQQYSEPGATCDLYVAHGGHSTTIAVLSGADNLDWGKSPEPQALTTLTARVSPNGQWLAFISQQQLTAYNNTDAVSGHPDDEVYIYHATTSTLRCASCNPTGAQPHGEENGPNTKLVTGDQEAAYTQWFAADLPGWTPNRLNHAEYQSRYLSDNGRLFFNSHDGLVPQDENNQWDVYEYEPPAVGSCTTESAAYHAEAGGCTSIISSGTSSEESAFLDASETGGDVFFLTHAPLSPQDTDTALDVYDAHECTDASPCIAQQPAPPARCTTIETCRPTGNIQGAEVPPPSATISPSPLLAATATSAAAGKPKAPTRAQKLAAELRKCRRLHGKKRRRACERHAHRSYARNARTGRRAAR